MTEPRALPKSPRLLSPQDTINAVIELYKSLGQLITVVQEIKTKPIQFRVDTNAGFTASDPILAVGEPAYTSDTHLLRVGDGVSHWSTLVNV